MMLPLVLAVVQAARPCPELPLAPGTTWTYHAAVAWTAVGDPTVRHDSLAWRTEILERRRVDSVVVATVQGWPAELAWWTPGQHPATSLIVCLAGRVYHLSPDTASLPSIADSLLHGQRRPSLDELVLQFPLRLGALFGRDAAVRPDGMYAWDVERASPTSAPPARWAHGLGDSVFTLVYRTVPDHQVVTFIPHVGIVDYVYTHHGTVADAHAWLVDFHPAPGP